jgi:hypothetical protein
MRPDRVIYVYAQLRGMANMERLLGAVVARGPAAEQIIADRGERGFMMHFANLHGEST